MKNVTIITPYYKGKKTIFKTIDSVFKSAEREKNKNQLYSCYRQHGR